MALAPMTEEEISRAAEMPGDTSFARELLERASPQLAALLDADEFTEEEILAP